MSAVASITTPYIAIQAAAERSGFSVITLRRYIRDGRLPAVKIGGKVFVTEANLDASIAPHVIVPKTEDLKAWAERMAAAAPPLRPEQRDLIVSTFASALGGASR
ncbi:helix-turn-helix domain-containing protein [Arthrobacter sp. U41]|uniref:helix-turn-helix domain-containing protein n=1 Tax=Arthrobacter sp. U41 TaxID=1849032 RepID=UPI00085935AF|nr:helix-turn-helix domain-containing protein [Arthrobacter sp. U41]AOT04723.1 hypothetical protein ASPU41_16775 [Arthrobacter sp. U41]